MSLLEETVNAVRDECHRQMRVSGLPASIIGSISDTETGNLFKGHPLTLAALPLLAYEAVGGGLAHDVLAAGAAMEFLLAAGDVLDDLQDGAPQESALSGRGAVLYSVRQTELVVALLLLCERSMLALGESGIPPHRVLKAARLLTELKLRAFAGQIEDVESGESSDESPERSLQIVEHKSGSLGRAAGSIGALLGTDDRAITALVAEFGERVGIICQLNNDIADLWPVTGKLEDLASGKKTLPIAYAHAISGVPASGSEAATPGPGDSSSLTALRDRVFESGGIEFALMHVGVQLVKARGTARRIKEMNPASRLSELLETTHEHAHR